MTASDELRQIADTLILVDPDAYERLHRIANELAEREDKMQRGLDDLMKTIDQSLSVLRPADGIIEPLLERALRLSSREKL